MTNKLQRSFSAVDSLLERPRIARRVVAALLVVHTLLLGYSAYVHSPTLNEPGHLIAGLSNWKFGRFDVYNVNPPLVQMVAALPVMAVGYNEDWSGYFERPGARPEFRMGEDFVEANGERSFFLFMIARWACIPFSWIGAIVCFLWARDLYGQPAGALACCIWCFEPNILAHASLTTPDAGATALGVAACYAFWRWLKYPNWGGAVLVGVLLGFAELAKSTLILFFPLWPAMWIVYRRSEKRQIEGAAWFREARMLALIMLTALYVLNFGYDFEGSFTKLKDFQFVSSLLNDSAADTISLEGSRINRFAHSWCGNIRMPVPRNYLLGIDLQQRDFEDYGRPSYLNGTWQNDGWWYYYVYACAMKIPIGLSLLGIITLTLLLWEGAVGWLYKMTRRPFDHQQSADAAICHVDIASHSVIHLRDEYVLLSPSVLIFLVVSFKSGFSEHMRYVLPCFPFLFVWLSRLCRDSVVKRIFRADGRLTGCSSGPMKATLNATVFFALVSLIWCVTSSAWCYPHELSYFNEAVGGPLRGSAHLLGSNVDWGQDLRYVQNAVKQIETRESLPVAMLTQVRYDLNMFSIVRLTEHLWRTRPTHLLVIVDKTSAAGGDWLTSELVKEVMKRGQQVEVSGLPATTFVAYLCSNGTGT